MPIINFILKLATQPKFLVIAGLIIMVAAILMLKTLTPLTPINKSQLTQQNFDQSTSTFQLQFRGSTPTLPKTLPIGQVVTNATSQTELLKPLLKKFALEPVSGDPALWTNPDYALIKDEGSGMFTLASQKPAQRSARIDEASTISTAQNLMQQLFPQTKLTIIPAQTRYLAGSEEQKVVNPNQAEVIEFVFAPVFDNYPVLVKNSSQSLVQAEFDSAQQLIKLTFLPEVANLSLVPGEGKEFDLYSVDQAVANINRGDGAVIAADSSQVSGINLNTKLTGAFSQVVLEYRSTDQNQVLPYYRFSGSLTADGVVITSDIITPAIDLTTIPSP